MPRLVLWYEAQPFHINQPWGVKDKLYEQFGFERHNGIDIAHGYNSRIRAPFPYQVYRTLWQPSGGGLVLSIVSQEKYQAPDGKLANVIIDYLHLSKYVKTQGQGDIGDLLCIAGNTGLSTGPHTHIQPRWVRMKNSKWVDVDLNDANNSFDPMPYYCGKYAVDYTKAPEPVIEAHSVEDTVQEVKAGLEGIQAVPEAAQAPLIELWKAVLTALSRLLTKG